MIGYIVARHFHYDCTEPHPESEPSKVYLDKAEAEGIARQLDSDLESGEVWEIELPRVGEILGRVVNSHPPCACRNVCGDVAEDDDDPLAVCKQLLGSEWHGSLT